MEHIEKSRFAHVGQSAQESESIKRQSLTFMQDAMRRLWKNKVAVVCVAVILLLTAMSIFAPMVSKFDYREQHYSHTNAPMGTVCNESGAEGEGHVHYFGTDTLGRDIFTRIWMGGRVSLTIAVVSALVDLILGSIYGGVSGYFGGTLDIIMMRLLEIINGIPYLIIVILLMMILRPGMMTIIIAYSLVGWIPMARLVRGQVVALKSAIFSEAYLSYIGLGIPLPMCSWGSLAQLGIENFRIYPYQLIIPAICISLTMLAFNMFGDGLRDAFDPRLRR